MSAKARSSTDATPLTDALNQALASTYSLMGLAHHAHWNVEGTHFFTLHQEFENEYRDLFAASDEIAERIRALDGYAQGGLSALSRRGRVEEISAPASDKDLASAVIAGHERVVEDLTRARDLAEKAGDLETQDLMIARLQVHQKTLWMLRSFLKK